MAKVVRRRVGGGTYYYLQHSLRRGSRVTKREVYLGKRIPPDIDARRAALELEAWREQWIERLDTIQKSYLAERRQLSPTETEKENADFAVRFTYDTQRIEGSTLSLRETADLLDHGLAPAGKPMRDAKEAAAHEAVLRSVLEHRKPLDRLAVLAWHRRLFADTRPDIAGSFRSHGVRISGSSFVPPSPVELEPLLHEFFEWCKGPGGRLHPVERAALVHLRFVTIHPFADGNGRLSRLIMNHELARARFPLFNIPYIRRAAYYTALERSQTRGEALPFLRWFVRGYIKANQKFDK